jgi:microcin-processing metallopeptidase PmbA/TldD-like protein
VISQIAFKAHVFLGGAALQRCDKDHLSNSGFSRWGGRVEELTLTARPQRLKPQSQEDINRTAEALRHPKAIPRAISKSSPQFELVSFVFRFSLLAVAILCGVSSSARAANPTSSDPLLRALREEMDRSKAQLKMENVAAPYYIEYRVTEIDQFEASAVFGALRSQQHDHGRLLRVTVRVGDYKQDSFYGSGEGTIDLVPADDDVFAIRHRVWLATDRAYKAATEALSAKQAALKQLKVDEPVDDFAHASPVEVIEPLAHLSIADFTPWVHLLGESSAAYRADKDLETFDSSLRFTAENRYFLNSEGTIARTADAHYAIYVTGSTQAADGMLLQRSHGDQGGDLKELPTREEFLKTTVQLRDTLKLLRDAPVVEEEYRGPVLFSNDAAATVVSDLVEPNVLGKKPKLGENARTTGHWASSYKSRVLPDFINVFDDPTISALSGKRLFGNYAIDDEGVRAQRVSLIEKGQLVAYLVGREPIRDFPVSNGHGRSGATTAPVPQVGNLILQSANPQSDAELKGKLMEMCKQRELPYCFYVQTMGPRLTPRLLYRIWTKDGHEELVRGAVFGDLDVRSLRSNLIAAGSALDVEDRFDPVAYSVASPALLFDELQIKRTQSAKQKLPEYPAPPLAAANRDAR